METATAVLYRIDRRDVLVETGGAWDAFAAANGALGAVLGRPLWHFVSGEDVRAVWSLLLRHARKVKRPLTFVYRCDAPGVRRLMQMQLLAGSEDSVAFRSSVVRIVNAPTVAGSPRTRRSSGSRSRSVCRTGSARRARASYALSRARSQSTTSCALRSGGNTG